MLRKLSTIGLPVFATRKRVLLLACTILLSAAVLLLLPWALQAGHRPAGAIDHSAERVAGPRDAEPGARSAALTMPGTTRAGVSQERAISAPGWRRMPGTSPRPTAFPALVRSIPPMRRSSWNVSARRLRDESSARDSSPPSLPGLTRQSINFAKCLL